MEDAAIVALYWARDEQALAETTAKFGAYCRKIADNILHSAHDAEECENGLDFVVLGFLCQILVICLAAGGNFLGRVVGVAKVADEGCWARSCVLGGERGRLVCPTGCR